MTELTRIVDISFHLPSPKLDSSAQSELVLNDMFSKYLDPLMNSHDETSCFEITVKPHLLPLLSGMILGYPCIYTTETEKTCLFDRQLKRITISACKHLQDEPLIACCYTVPVSSDEQENETFSQTILKHFELVKSRNADNSFTLSCRVDIIQASVALV